MISFTGGNRSSWWEVKVPPEISKTVCSNLLVRGCRWSNWDLPSEICWHFAITILLLTVAERSSPCFQINICSYKALICFSASGLLWEPQTTIFKCPSATHIRPRVVSFSSGIDHPHESATQSSLSSWTECSPRHPLLWHPSRSSWPPGMGRPCSRDGRGFSHRRSKTGWGSRGS